MSDNNELIAKYKRYLANAISTRDSTAESRTPGTTKAVVAQIPEYETIIAALEAADKQGEAVVWIAADDLADMVRIAAKDMYTCATVGNKAQTNAIALYTHPQPDRKEIEDEVIERCAKECEKQCYFSLESARMPRRAHCLDGPDQGVIRCADAVRALKGSK